MSYTRTFPTARLWDPQHDKLSLRAGSPLSDTLLSLNFEPELLGRDRKGLTALIPQKQHL